MEPIAVSFPLRGEWCAVNTPGYVVPSHGTDAMGQTFAYDFTQIDWSKKGYKFYKGSSTRNAFFGTKLKDTYCWGAPIYSPFDGTVVQTYDGVMERNPAHLMRDVFILLKNSFFSTVHLIQICIACWGIFW